MAIMDLFNRTPTPNIAQRESPFLSVIPTTITVWHSQGSIYIYIYYIYNAFFKFTKIQKWFICFTINLQILFFFSIKDLLQCFFLENVLLDIAIDERVFMTWRKHSDEVPNIFIDNTNKLSEGVCNAAFRLRRRFTRTSYVQRDVLEFAWKNQNEMTRFVF